MQDWRVGGATAAALCGSELLQRTLAALQPLLRWARARRAARRGIHAVTVAEAEAEEQQPLQAGRTPRGTAAAPPLYDNATPPTDPDVRARPSQLAAHATAASMPARLHVCSVLQC